MPAACSPARQTGQHRDGAPSHRPVTAAGEDREAFAALRRQDRPRVLEPATLTAATRARIGRDIGRALALRFLRDRPDARSDELRNGTSEPGRSERQ